MSGFDAIELALEVGKILWEYIETVRSVDKTIQDLKLQVDGLGRVLQDLCAVVDCPEFGELRMTGSEGLRQNIPLLIQNCHETLVETEHLARALSTSGKETAWKKHWRAIKLMTSQGDIDNLLSQLKTHSMNLQMAVTTANLMVSVHSPRALMSAQTQHFDRLEHMLVAIAEQISPAGSRLTNAGGSWNMGKINQDKNTRTLQTCAMQAMSGASTLAGMSVSGRTLVADDIAAFDYIGGKKTPASTPTLTYQESTTGSEFGFPLDERKSSQVQEWIKGSSPLATPPETPEPTPQPLREQASRTTTQSSGGSGLVSLFSSWSLGGTTQTSEPPSLLYNDEGDNECEEFEITQRKFKRANEQLVSNNLVNASKLFQEGFDAASRLGPRSQEKLDVLGMKLKFATCCSSTIGPALSESSLIDVMQTPPISATVLEQTLAATHQLAYFKLQQNDLNAAEIYCRQALKGRRQARSIGNKHPDYYASLKLLVDILSAKQDYAAARDHADLLPLELNGDLDRRLAILQSMQSSKNSSYLEPTPPPLPMRPRSPIRYPSAKMSTAR